MPRQFISTAGSLAALCVLFYPVRIVTAQEQTPAARQPIRVAVERVNVGVIVTDARGKFLEGLRREDFQVLDNGAAQAITEFSSFETPGQVLLMLEAGPAVYLLQDLHLFVADTLLDGLAAVDRVAVACYNENVTALLDFTPDKVAAQGALDRAAFNLGYGNLNLAVSLNSVQDWLAKVPGKKTVVLVSTGVDTSPQASMQTTLARLQTGDERLLAISMSGPLRSTKPSKKPKVQQTDQALAEADTWLKALAEASGGRAYFPENGRALHEIYRQVAELVRHEYSLAFAPPVADGAAHTIEVKVIDRSGVAKATEYHVDHRKGYVAPKPPE